jgi:hypothetical protein
VRSFVDLHGGWVALASEPGKGTIVTCHFPVRTPAAAPAAAKRRLTEEYRAGRRPEPAPSR